MRENLIWWRTLLAGVLLVSAAIAGSKLFLEDHVPALVAGQTVSQASVPSQVVQAVLARNSNGMASASLRFMIPSVLGA